jgi:hypothetical protein
VGGGIYYGDVQIGNQLAFTYNGGNRFNLSQLTSPGLAYPVDLNPNVSLGTAPDETERHRQSEMNQQWTAQIQQSLPWGFTSQVSYVGSETSHVFAQTPDNVVNPLTGKRTLPNFDQVNYKGDWGVASFHGLLAGLQRTAKNGLFLGMNYTYGHAINDSDGAPQNVSCRSCEKSSANYDVRQNLYVQSSYPLPLGHFALLRNWTVSGVGSIRTGLPLTVTVTRKTTDVLDGNNAGQRPNLVPGVSLTPAGGQTINAWINPAAFSIPAKGTWGNAGRALIRAPGLFQIDTAIARNIRITEKTNVSLRMEAFNVFNRTELGSPTVNLSSPSFGQILAVSNTSPIGTGSARSIQLAVRFTF